MIGIKTFACLVFAGLGVLFPIVPCGAEEALPIIDPREAGELARDAGLRPVFTVPWFDGSYPYPDVEFSPFGGLFSVTTEDGDIYFCSYPRCNTEPVFSADRPDDLLAWCHVGPDRIAVSLESHPGEIRLLKFGRTRDSLWDVLEEQVIRTGGTSPWRMQYSDWCGAFILHTDQEVTLFSLSQRKTIARLAPCSNDHRGRTIESLRIRFSRSGRYLATTPSPSMDVLLYRLPPAAELQELPPPLQRRKLEQFGRVYLWNEDDFLLRDQHGLCRLSAEGVIERSLRPESRFGVFSTGGGGVVGTTSLPPVPGEDGKPISRTGVAVVSGDRFEKVVEWKQEEGFNPFALSPNGRILANQEGVGVMTSATFFDVETGRRLVSPEVVLNDHSSLTFSPDGDYFITFGHSDLRLWRTPLLLKERLDGTFERLRLGPR